VLKGVIYADTGTAPGALLGVSEQLTFKSTEAAGCMTSSSLRR